MNRREFGKLLGAGALLAAIWPVSKAWAKKVGVKLAQITGVKKVGGWALAMIKGKPVLVARVDEKKVMACSGQCTHQKANLTFNPKTGHIECPAHHSIFDGSTGKVLNGPATEPLAIYPAKLDDKRVIIALPNAAKAG